MNQSFQHNNKAVEFLSLRLFPAKLEIQAKAELLSGDKRDAAMRYIEAIEDYESCLVQLSEKALQQVVDDERDSDLELDRVKAELEENNRFFYQRSARADYSDWIEREKWSVDEATALLLGKNPDVVSWNSVNPLVYKSKFAKRYGDLRQQLQIARDAGKLHKSLIPAAYLYYARSAGFALPAELEAMIVQIVEAKEVPTMPLQGPGAPQEVDDVDHNVSMFRHLLAENRKTMKDAKPKPSEQAKPASDSLMSMRQERETLLKMLGALAIGHYGLQPGLEDMAITERIVSDFQKGGLSVNPAAAHKLICDAASLLGRKTG